ncbi:MULTISPECIES: hypothetical protein [unclassified Campylobacter]|uniref:hypothetical protein n=1 Tax=unclassified Campylobacter TaxID=2593542 RepID=UPI001237BD49|nr:MULTISPECIES: hypothetical protein [unclassified Campylobacter]KAA6226391.1 hypothetical protein FMM57_06305 [Campylobacter sp. LR286c]KAA6226571.1 hypothetical protein FMM54_03930 [Campylobacter sp. LR185c]KAA6226882.1 hypothetical protein FMM55_04870 [Campylobacter sp. LR196d]KAA6230320.1 hypothetical protein FMM58_06505 [Campylobacter sp. LR291e]KAA6233843.1 hypothetical protein FMM56_02730 [Campylobacter sp. LR264d]
MQNALFINEASEKIKALKDRGLSFYNANYAIKKEYNSKLDAKTKFVKFSTLLAFIATFLLGIYVYYLILKIEVEMYAYTQVAYGAVFLFFIVGFVFLALLFFNKEVIFDYLSLNNKLCKEYDESVFKLYFKYLFLLFLFFCFISFVLLSFIAYEYAVYTNTDFIMNFTYMLAELFD